MPASNTIVVTTRYVDRWLIIPVVLLFPMGLPLLLLKSTGVTTLLVTPCQGGCDVQVAGWLGRQSFARRLEELFDRLAAPGEAASPAPVFGAAPAMPGATSTRVASTMPDASPTPASSSFEPRPARSASPIPSMDPMVAPTAAPTPDPAAATCHGCGSPLTPGAKFCGTCGTPLARALGG